MARKYRGGATAHQRRQINPGPLTRIGGKDARGQEPQDTVTFHRAQQAQGQGRLIPKGMPIDHLVPPTLGSLPSNVRTWEKVPSPVELWTSHLQPCAPTRQIFSAVPSVNWNIENGWVL